MAELNPDVEGPWYRSAGLPSVAPCTSSACNCFLLRRPRQVDRDAMAVPADAPVTYAAATSADAVDGRSSCPDRTHDWRNDRDLARGTVDRLAAEKSDVPVLEAGERAIRAPAGPCRPDV